MVPHSPFGQTRVVGPFTKEDAWDWRRNNKQVWKEDTYFFVAKLEDVSLRLVTQERNQEEPYISPTRHMWGVRS